jgi:hypothetical protein
MAISAAFHTVNFFSNGGARPYFRENTASKNLTAATAAIWAICPAASPFSAQ